MSGAAARPPRALVVDDDAAMRDSLEDLLSAAGWLAETAGRGRDALRRAAALSPDVILTDVRMPGMSGIELLEALQTVDAPPVVLISAHGDIPMAVEALQKGAYSFIEKPYEPHRLLQVLKHAAEQHVMARTTERLRERLAKLSGLDRVLLGETDELHALRAEILDLAQTSTSVLLLGETGTGKELVARALHDLGTTSEGPFVAINAATLSPDRFEREMFGSEGGDRGRLTEAHGGTLFLDEICSCPERVQAKLLRVVETGMVRPVDSKRSHAVSFRLISASNEDPEGAMRAGRLRADLFYRISAFILRLPPLRQRLADLPLLFEHFAADHARLYEIEPPALTNEDLAALMSHDWPGNVRELRNVAERRVLAARRGRGSVGEAIAPDQGLDDVPSTLREAVAAFEREVIGQAIRTHGARMDAVAEALGIGRRTLNDKIVKLNLDKEDWLDG